jgi:hypothetical protein
MSAGMATAALLPMNGSDTLFDAITKAISLSGVQINYLGGGSGKGESALLAHTQGIAPMSRNLANAIIGPGGSHTTWSPSTNNIIALDGAVFVQKNVATKCPNIQEFKSLPNNPATHWMKLILGGVDGSGSAAACEHQARLDALQALADCMNVLQIDHVYRRDDNSGTSDTMKEKLGICNFCNNGSAASKGPLNTSNADNDPIRRTCVSGASFSATPCTGGTLGLVVALSQPDPGASDITVSIGRRAALDPQGQTFGYAGREAAFSVPGATKVNVHTIVPSIANIRVGVYDLARRLYLQQGDLNDPNVVTLDPTGQQKQLLAWVTGIGQENFPAMCTDSSGNPICGRPNMDPVMTSFGFVSCTDDPFDTPVPPNLCGTSAPPYIGPTCTACGAPTATCTTGTDCCSGTCTNSVCQSCRPAAFGCTTNADCCSGFCDTTALPAPTCN